MNLPRLLVGVGDPNDWGYILDWLDPHDPTPAKEQIDRNYQHGGGWRDFPGFTVKGGDGNKFTLHYPGDPPQREISRLYFGEELVVLFEHSIVMIVQADGSHVIAHID